jgi:predicted MPP superfamily phosphohydrolase
MFTMTPSRSDLYRLLEPRVGRLHLEQRLGIEADREHLVFGQGRKFFHLENWYSIHALIRHSLRLFGLHGRGRRNARRIQVRRNEIGLDRLPGAFDGFTILHLSDLHVDMDEDFPGVLGDRVRDLEYDICVLSGDFRYLPAGPVEAAVAGMRRLRMNLAEHVYGVLGNHDTIEMVPALEAMGIRMLLNESLALHRGGESIHLAGIDDPHYYRADNFERACGGIPPGRPAILLAHSPEVYKQAAHAGFDLMLCGHTHGGQICLPGGVPLMLNAKCPRRVCRGAWRHHRMHGYTSAGAGSSIVDIRLNNLPEVTLHCLRSI